ncbi:Glycogen synthase [Phycisphaerae bacterium RAS1]|nr:Glycogen synthase [Phycisphaerae bacterium RAS1]
MRIAMLSWESLHSIAVGGLAVHVSNLAGALQRNGHDVHVFTRTGPAQAPCERLDGVHYHRCSFESPPDFLVQIEQMNQALFSRLHSVEGQAQTPFDIVHAHDWLCVGALVRARNELGRASALTMHSTEYGRSGNQHWDGPSARIRDIEWEGTYVAQRVICVSRALAREVCELYGTPPDKVCPIYNGVDVRSFDGRVDSGAVKRHYGIAGHAPTVLFAGRMTSQKGPDLLLKAIPRILQAQPDATVVFAGDGDMRAALEHGARWAGLGSATRFVGHKSGQDLVNLFRSADVVCVPSRNEPFGIVVLEAWSARKAVVATRNGGPGEFVRHEHNGLTVRADADAIGWGLRVALHDAKHARRLGQNGRREAESRFSWDRIARETERVYDAVTECVTPRHDAARANKEFTMLQHENRIRRESGRNAVRRVSQEVSDAPAIRRPTESDSRTRTYAKHVGRGPLSSPPLDAARELCEQYGSYESQSV